MDLTLFENENYKKKADSKQHKKEARITVFLLNHCFFLKN